MNATSTKKLVKLAVVGDGGVGKSTLISRLATGTFVDKTMTIGFDVESWTVTTNGDGALKVCMFDFGGQQQFRFFQGSLMMGAKAALVVFDCTSFRSLLQIDEWLEMISAVPNDKKILVGTKIDVADEIDEEGIREFAQEHDMEFILVSSKTGDNFDTLLEKLREICASI